MRNKLKAADPEIHGLPHHIPSHVLESILARLPVKPILCFRSVCKLWNQIISDPHFSNLHSQLRAASSSSSTRFLIWGKPSNNSDSNSFCLLNLSRQGFQFRLDADLGSPSPDPMIKCYCNGLVLLSCQFDKYMVWSPYTRMRKTIPSGISLPEALGICHDPTTDDYKVVVIDTSPKRFSVFSCKKGVWTKRDERLNYLGWINKRAAGVYLDGAYYWIFTHDGHRNLLRFNGVEDTCEMLQLPASVAKNSVYIILLNLGGCLGVIYSKRTPLAMNYHIERMENNGDRNSWRQQVVDIGHNNFRFLNLHGRPPCPISDRLLVIFLLESSKFIVYDIHKECIVEGPLCFPRRWKRRMLVPYHERLFISMF